MADIDGVPLAKLVSTYTKIRNKRAEQKQAFEKTDKDLREQMDRIKLALLDYCKDEDVESVRTSAGTFYRTVRTRYWTSDWGSMYEFVHKNNLPEFFEKRLNQTAVREFLEDHPDESPKGLNIDSSYAISVRKA